VKISGNMLNCLGYMRSRSGFSGRDTVIGLLTVLGERSAIKRGYIVPSTYDMTASIPGAPPPGTELPGYRLTELGEQLGEIGLRMRAEQCPHKNLWRDNPPAYKDWAMERSKRYAAEAANLLKERTA
jgi:hypothetical protein